MIRHKAGRTATQFPFNKSFYSPRATAVIITAEMFCWCSAVYLHRWRSVINPESININPNVGILVVKKIEQI